MPEIKGNPKTAEDAVWWAEMDNNTGLMIGTVDSENEISSNQFMK